MQEKENPHSNHRSRMRERVKNYGLESLNYHEALEFFLFYPISRINTNPLAHDLINYFGSFKNVIDADYNDLLKVKGVGPETALFINSLSQFIDVYNNSKRETASSVLNTTSECVKFFRDHFRIKTNEFMILACLNKNKKVIKTFRYKGYSETEIFLNLQQLVNDMNNKGVSSVVLFHTHPGGEVTPSLDDFKTTQSLLNVSLTLGIDFDDHIVLNEFEHYSFANYELIGEMKKKFLNAVDVNDIYIKSIYSLAQKNIDSSENK